MRLRTLAQGSATGAAPTINPNNFGSEIDNPYFALDPGTTFIYKSPDGTSVDRFIVTRQTKEILGVTCVVVMDLAYENGELVEKTFDYFAQDKKGNVWYFGEATQELEDGKVVSTEGSWQAGLNGATPGIIMEAHPHVGDRYDQEHAAGVAEDKARVDSLNAHATVPYGSFGHVLDTAEFTPLEPGVVEHKFYARGIGEVLEVDADGNRLQLVKIEIRGTSEADALHGKVGPDELFGLAGNDRLNGLAGSDTIHGGAGNDFLLGGNDHATDFLYGDAGNDKIGVGLHDRGYGGAGNDLMLLFDNEHFGAVNGGSEPIHDLGKAAGDILSFHGELDLTTSGLSERITGIETLSMKGGHGHDTLALSVQDVLDLGTGNFDPKFASNDALGRHDAVRINGNCGDHVTLTGGDWSQIHPNNAPHGYDVFSAQTSAGSAYVLVQADVMVNVETA
jgi:Ca2+-binding RTX toxin-like protein